MNQQLATIDGTTGATDDYTGACPWPIKIFTLGRFGILLGGRPLAFSGRVQRKPLELLMAIIAFGGRDVACDAVTDALWPELDGDAASDALAKTLRRLRALLNDNSVVWLRDGKLALNTNLMWIDKLELERRLGQAVEEFEVARVTKLYRGDFLCGEGSIPWLVKPRNRLRLRVLTSFARKGRILIQRGSLAEAIELFEAGLEIDPVAEELYLHLMRCHLALGQITEGLAVYRRCQAQLICAVQTAPTLELQKLYDKLQSLARR